MPASLRIEIFPSDLQAFIDFYSNVLKFKLIKQVDDYAYLQRDNIFIGAVETASADTVEEREKYRQPNKGVEIVFEVDDLEAQRDHVAGQWRLHKDIELQPWGLRDFRIIDPDGYLIRVTEHSPQRDGQGSNQHTAG
jgi:lactoylglutathione lyase